MKKSQANWVINNCNLSFIDRVQKRLKYLSKKEDISVIDKLKPLQDLYNYQYLGMYNKLIK